MQGLKAHAKDYNRAAFFYIDFSRCSLCGLCVEICPTQALAFSRQYEQVGLGRYCGVNDLIARLGRRVP